MSNRVQSWRKVNTDLTKRNLNWTADWRRYGCQVVEKLPSDR